MDRSPTLKQYDYIKMLIENGHEAPEGYPRITAKDAGNYISAAQEDSLRRPRQQLRSPRSECEAKRLTGGRPVLIVVFHSHAGNDQYERPGHHSRSERTATDVGTGSERAGSKDRRFSADISQGLEKIN